MSVIVLSVDQDTYLRELTPTTGYGGGTNLFIEGKTSNRRRTLLLKDLSAIYSSDEIIVSANLQLWQNIGNASAEGKLYGIYRSTKVDWENGNGLNVEANWDNYKDPNVPWATAGGDKVDTDAALGFTVDYDNIGYVAHNIRALVQDAITNRAGILSLLIKYETEGDALFTFVGFDSCVNTHPPILTITIADFYTWQAGILDD